MKKTNSNRLSKQGKIRIEQLINNIFVNEYHKNLLKSIKHNAENKNLQITDIELLKIISGQYD